MRGRIPVVIAIAGLLAAAQACGDAADSPRSVATTVPHASVSPTPAHLSTEVTEEKRLRVYTHEALDPALFESLLNEPNFAGTYIDDRGFIVVQGVGNLSNLEVLVSQYEGAKLLVRLLPAQHTYAELEEKMHEIASAVEDLRARGVLIQAIGIDELSNIVQIEVLDVTRSEDSYLRKNFGGDLVQVVNADGPYTHLE